MIHTRRMFYAVSLAGAALFLGGCAQSGTGALSLVENMSISYGSALAYLKDSFHGAESQVSAFASPETSAAGSQVNRLLAKLRGETENALRAEDRSRETARREDMRRQLDPANPTNAVKDQQDRSNDRAAAIEDKVQSRQDAQQKEALQK